MERSPAEPGPELLAPGRFVDSDHPDVVAFSREVCAGASGDRERASRLFAAVRERLRYDPYTISSDPDEYVASKLLGRTRAYCIPKAVLLCAAARAAGIPARLGFADVKNHLASEKLLRTLGSDLFAFHGYVELWIDGRPLKASPAFNASLCARFGVPALDFDGEHDALLQAFDGEGRRYMEYVRDRGLYLDLPLDEILETFAGLYRSPPPAGTHDEAFHG
ncbi:MAG TPA: transglutaminase family protein [Kofleriaceae bacterium]|nr:transglutaminase family protein [Kofleriaceae bacterium]